MASSGSMMLRGSAKTEIAHHVGRQNLAVAINDIRPCRAERRKNGCAPHRLLIVGCNPELDQPAGQGCEEDGECESGKADPGTPLVRRAGETVPAIRQ